MLLQPITVIRDSRWATLVTNIQTGVKHLKGIAFENSNGQIYLFA